MLDCDDVSEVEADDVKVVDTDVVADVLCVTVTVLVTVLEAEDLTDEVAEVVTVVLSELTSHFINLSVPNSSIAVFNNSIVAWQLPTLIANSLVGSRQRIMLLAVPNETVSIIRSRPCTVELQSDSLPLFVILPWLILNDVQVRLGWASGLQLAIKSFSAAACC